MDGTPKVVVALVLAILAVPPVVNAIMAKAAEQADVDWLQDGDQSPPDIDPPPQVREGDDETEIPHSEPPRAATPPPPCEPEAGDGVSEQLEPPASMTTQVGAITIEVEPGDVGVGYQVGGQTVIGTLRFRVDQDGTERWQEEFQFAGDSFTAPPPEDAAHPAIPGQRWTLSYDLSNAVYQRIVVMLFPLRCPEAGR